jgi:hypothetical protein
VATDGELAVARLVERLLRLEAEYENRVDAVKAEYQQWWKHMSKQEMEEFIQLLGLQDKKALRQFIIARGQATRALIFPEWMLEE